MYFINPIYLLCKRKVTFISTKVASFIAQDSNALKDDSIRIRVTRNGEIYVTAEDVLKSAKFKEQLEAMAKIHIASRKTIKENKI